ncbi:hypothetical protein KW791_02125 [Candidatus Parcubacteria bacterium]|nr:hypothetical protein [Candidatus Parcubacteria bacterium]
MSNSVDILFKIKSLERSTEDRLRKSEEEYTKALLREVRELRNQKSAAAN